MFIASTKYKEITIMKKILLLTLLGSLQYGISHAMVAVHIESADAPAESAAAPSKEESLVSKALAILRFCGASDDIAQYIGHSDAVMLTDAEARDNANNDTEGTCCRYIVHKIILQVYAAQQNPLILTD